MQSPTPPPAGHQPSHPQENYTAPPIENDVTTPDATNIYAAPSASQSSTAPENETPHAPYEFIMNPSSNAPRNLFGGFKGTLPRLILVLGGIFVLLLIFVGLKNALGGGGLNATSLITVAQYQQQLIHIAGEANNQTGTSVTTQNSSATIQLSVASSQNQLLGYMSKNHIKVKPATLNLKVSNSVDTQLTASASAGNYDQTYSSVISTALTGYLQALKSAYAQMDGPKGKALLNSEYTTAQLLQTQLNSPSN